jgi:hypothetical protein
MRTRRYVIYAILFVIMTTICVVFFKSGAALKGSVAQSGDILHIEKHYAALTNCTISFIQKSTMIGSMEGSISIKTNADIAVEWREHQNYVGDFTNTIYTEGKAGIWQRYQSNNTKYQSLASALEAAKGVSHGVSYLIPMMLLGGKSLGDPLLWKPVFFKESDKNECALENKKNLVSFLIVYDPKTFEIIKTSRKIKITFGIVDEETAYVENKAN